MQIAPETEMMHELTPEADREKHYSVGFCLDCAAEEQKKDGAQDQ